MNASFFIVYEKAHPSIKGSAIDWQGSLDSVQDCLNLIYNLSFFNIAVAVETFHNLLDSSHRNEIHDKLTDILVAFNTDTKGFISLDPDVENYPRQLKISHGKISL